jgi:GNAT superfamily N-acetyltransferase
VGTSGRPATPSPTPEDAAPPAVAGDPAAGTAAQPAMAGDDTAADTAAQPTMAGDDTAAADGAASRTPDAEARTATRADVGAVEPLVEAAAVEKADQKGGAVWSRRERRAGPVAEALAQAVDAPDYELAVGLWDGSVVGYALARADRLADGGVLGVIDDLYVDPAARAVGVGEALMDHLLEWCRAQGCFGVDSIALPGDRSTKNFFESFGLVARAIVVHRSLD